MQAVATAPKTIEAAYHDVLERIGRSQPGDKDLAIRVFTWLSFTPRPMLMVELLEALVVEEGDRELHRDYILDPSDIVECCQSLVQYDGDTGVVRFSHETVQKFMRDQQLLSCRYIAQVCLTCLGFQEFATRCCGGKALYERYLRTRFATYAATLWPQFVKQFESDDAIGPTIFKLLEEEPTRYAILQLERYDASAQRHGYVHKGQSMMHVLSRAGLEELCVCYLKAKFKGYVLH
jgi:hypothetical protein